MIINDFNYKNIKEKYLSFIKGQEILSEPFRDKINQLNKKIHRAEEQENENKIWWRKMKLEKLKDKLNKMK